MCSTSPYRPSTRNVPATPTIGEAKKKLLELEGGEEEGGEEVPVIPASQSLSATDPESQTRCGKCLFPLHWGRVLPSRCQQPRCQVLNLGPEWANNQRFRQSLRRGGLGEAKMEMGTGMGEEGWERWVDWGLSTYGE